MDNGLLFKWILLMFKVGVGVCYLHRDRTQLTFSGARFSLFQVDERGVNEIKGDKKGIGYRSPRLRTVFRSKPSPCTLAWPFIWRRMV